MRHSIVPHQASGRSGRRKSHQCCDVGLAGSLKTIETMVPVGISIRLFHNPGQFKIEIAASSATEVGLHLLPRAEAHAVLGTGVLGIGIRLLQAADILGVAGIRGIRAASHRRNLMRIEFFVQLAVTHLGTTIHCPCFCWCRALFQVWVVLRRLLSIGGPQNPSSLQIIIATSSTAEIGLHLIPRTEAHAMLGTSVLRVRICLLHTANILGVARVVERAAAHGSDLMLVEMLIQLPLANLRATVNCPGFAVVLRRSRCCQHDCNFGKLHVVLD